MIVLSDHPLQRAGVWAVTALAGRPHPSELTGSDLSKVAGMVADAATEASLADKGQPWYGWWKVLNNGFPNHHLVTHAKRNADLPPGPQGRTQRFADIQAMFDADQPGGPHGCVFCGQATWTLWLKKDFPMLGRGGVANVRSVTEGWPVCAGCRLAGWAVPWAAYITANTLTVLTAADPAVELRWAERRVRENKRWLATRPSDFPVRGVASPRNVAVRVVRSRAAGSKGGAALWTFKNSNNQAEAVVRVDRLSAGTPAWIARTWTDPGLRRSWAATAHLLRSTTGQGPGSLTVADLLWDPEDVTGTGRHRLPGQVASTVARMLGEPNPAAGFRASRAVLPLVLSYLQEVAMLNQADQAAVSAVADSVTAYILNGPQRTPRARLREFTNCYARPRDLEAFLVGMQEWAIRSGATAVVQPAAGMLLTTRGAGGDRHEQARTLLFFEVTARLAESGADFARAGSDEDSDTPEFFGDEDTDLGDETGDDDLVPAGT